MLIPIFSIFIMLHGLVHLLYFGQSQRYFELQPGMVWPEGSWAFSRLFGNKATRWLASISCALAAVGYVAGGASLLLLGLAWWRLLVAGSAAFSTVIFILCWDGKMRKLDNQGGIGILINIAILVIVLVLQWPG